MKLRDDEIALLRSMPKDFATYGRILPASAAKSRLGKKGLIRGRRMKVGHGFSWTLTAEGLAALQELENAGKEKTPTRVRPADE